MPLALAAAGALCAALIGFGCFKAVRLISQIKVYKEGTKAVNVTTPPDFLAMQGGLLGCGAALGRPLTFFRINDEVMGGKSVSSLAVSGGGLVFAGEINTNGGGFCSCRTLGDDGPLGLPAEVTALLIDATGDGKRHKLTLHTADSWAMSVPTWAADFVPVAGRRATHRLPLSTFVPTIRGRVVKGISLDPTAVTGLGFSLSLYSADGEPNPQFGPGPFSLQAHGVRVEVGNSM